MNNSRQTQRSGVSTAHHQRQYSDTFMDNNAFWSHSSAAPPQEYGYYGQAPRDTRNGQRSYAGGGEYYSEQSTPPLNPSRISRKNSEGQISSSEFSPGLLDLNSHDTELLTEVPGPGQYNSSFYPSFQSRSFDDMELPTSKAGMNRARGLQENNVMKSIAVDKDKISAVAKIKVVVRKRPLNKKELGKNEEDIIETNSNSLTVYETKLKVDLTEYVEKHNFVFDAVLNEEVSNDEVYRETVEPIVPIIFQRTKATCFAYGQTGSGKTYTMKPLPLKASRDILRLMHHTYRNQGFQLFFSFFEIYGGKLFDLLNDRKKLCMREDGKQQVCIVGLQEFRVSDVEMIKELIERGNGSRSTGTTGANEESSRSHAILQLAVKKTPDGAESKPPRLVGKLSFIDLAGSERGADTTDNDKQTRIEGAEINKSLLALKECIRALDNDQNHIPFRGSKLTEVLRDSFVGNSKTVMISCISPSSGSCEHTLNTLRYADRVKSLSKGNGPKKDILLPTANLRESTTLPLSSGTPAMLKDDSDLWSQPTEKEEYEIPDETYDQPKVTRRKNGKVESSTYISEEKVSTAKGHTKWKDVSKVDAKSLDSDDDDLNDLLQEEEDLVNAHRRQVEETMDIVKEEMNLLVEADEPGNQLDNYITRLNAILSQKAAGIVELQNRLANFQRRLKEHNVLVSSPAY
ncbi:kinesin-like protein KIN-13B [Silene latifolia]|uniref:kinesin-like protein KIN-13B n=1 Tax=Silene latifolia TaxID=37657 RepID=UPI003D781723